MNCDRRSDDWLLFAADGLDDTERRELAAHLAAGCPRCAGALAEAEAILAQLPLALDPVEPPRALRAQVLERVGGLRPAGRGTVRRAVPPPPPAWRPWLRPAIAAGVAVALTLAVSWTAYGRRQARLERQVASQAERIFELQSRVDTAAEFESLIARQAEEIERYRQAAGDAEQLRVQLNEHRSRIDRQGTDLEELAGLRQLLAESERTLASLRDQLDDRARMMALFRDPQVDVFALRGRGDAYGATARIFWDRGRDRWFFSASGLQPAGLARTYQLWFVTGDDRKVSAGTFDVGQAGTAAIELDLPQGLGVIAVAAVTREPMGGSLQPSGAILLAGEVPSG